MLRRIRTWWAFRGVVRQAARRAATGAPPAAGDIVVVPCWRRPEFLWHCLENLTRAEGIESVHVLFRPDVGYAAETLGVIDAFASRLPSYEVLPAKPCPFRRTKPSANFLLGLLHAAQRTRGLVYLVEEDIMVGRDFFRWHRGVHAQAPPLFCSIPVRNPNRRLDVAERIDGYYLSSGDSCSNGACYPAEVLRCCIAPHVNMAYLARPKRYLRRRFPDSAVGLGFVEQDGLIRRIQERSAWPIAWPCTPRAFHAGFFGARGGWQNFRRPDLLGDTLPERVRLLQQTIYSAEGMSRVIDRPEFLDTCMPCALELPGWSELRRVAVPAPAGRLDPELFRRLQA